MTIFKSTKKIGNRPAKQAEPYYEYIANSERPIAILVRDTLERWFTLYCSVVNDNEKINDLRARLQSSDNIQFSGAFTELYVFILLKNFGYEITAEKAVQNGKKPDFFAKSQEGKEFYVEVTTFSEGEFSKGRERAVNLIVDKINKNIKSANYAINLKWYGDPLENDVTSDVVKEIQGWIDNHNDTDFLKEFNEWSLQLTANPKISSGEGIVAYIANPKVQSYSSRKFLPDEITENVSDFLTDIKKTLTDKAKKYGKLEKPYIIVLNLLSNKIQESIVEDALLSETLKNRNRISQSFFNKQTNVNGVLVSFNLDPFNMMDGAIPRKESLYFINPNAAEAFDLTDFRKLFSKELFKENAHCLDRTKILTHLDLPQDKWNKALKDEDPDSKLKNAVNWMQTYIFLSNIGKDVHQFVTQPIQSRMPITYNRNFLDQYEPNVSSYLTSAEKEKLEKIGRIPMPDQPAGTYAKDILSRLLIDLSWNSSRLEGNTYSLLDTQRLIDFGETADSKSATETQMILNHKGAIEFLTQQDDNIGYNRHTILNVHALLSDNLLLDPSASGRLRTTQVGIYKSVYIPLAVPQLISELFDIILEKATQIKDPFEQAFFMMVHLPYLQPFDDVNKRVSRLVANIPFIRSNLAPLSFIDVPSDLYIHGMIGVYEINRIELIKDVFLWAYERSAARYVVLRQSLGEPDPFRIKYRENIKELISDIVSQLKKPKDASEIIKAKAEELPLRDQEKFIESVDTELLSLHEGNFARYRIRPSEFQNWKAMWLQKH